LDAHGLRLREATGTAAGERRDAGADRTAALRGPTRLIRRARVVRHPPKPGRPLVFPPRRDRSRQPERTARGGRRTRLRTTRRVTALSTHDRAPPRPAPATRAPCTRPPTGTRRRGSPGPLAARATARQRRGARERRPLTATMATSAVSACNAAAREDAGRSWLPRRERQAALRYARVGIHGEDAQGGVRAGGRAGLADGLA